MRQSKIAIAVLAIAGCGGEMSEELTDAIDEESTFKADTFQSCPIQISGQIRAMGDPLGNVIVVATDQAGKRTGRGVSLATGYYSLKTCSLPYQLQAKAINRVPRYFTKPKLVATAANQYKLDADLGPYLGADGTGRLLTYMLRRSAVDVEVVPQVAWGWSGIGSPFEDVADLMIGARTKQLVSLVPVGTKPVPSLESSVTRKTSTKGAYLELRLSAEANSLGYGAAYTMAYLQQLVGTTSVTYSDEGLPVRIRVACASCPGGYEEIRDGHVGATGPGGSYLLDVAAPDEMFTDVAGQRYVREIAMAKGLRVMTGYADGTFRPGKLVTRAELVAALVAALGLKTTLPCASVFKDVPSTSWYCASVEAARLAGIASGYTDGTFRPQNGVTRGELASYIVRAAKWPLTAPPKPTFTDVPATYWAYSRIETFVGWCRGGEPRALGSYQYQPAAAATRAEAGAGLMRALNCLTGDEVGN